MSKIKTVWRLNVHAKNQRTGQEPAGQDFCTYTVGEFETHVAACGALAKLDLNGIGAIGATIAPVESGTL